MKNEKFLCPFCYVKRKEKKYYNAKILIRHLFLFHNKGTKIAIIGISIAILGILGGIYSNDIRYFIDDVFTKSNVEVYSSFSIYHALSPKNAIITPEIKEIMIAKQKEIGAIPPWANKDPIRWGINNEERTSQIGCLFWAFDNLLWTDKSKLPKELASLNESISYGAFTLPSEQFFNLLSECEGCLAYVFFSQNSGYRFLDDLNLKICIKENFKIIYSSKNIYEESKNCFRLQSIDIPIGEIIQGYIMVRKEEGLNYTDFWDKNIFPVYEGTVKRISKMSEIEFIRSTRFVVIYVPDLIC